MFSTDNTYMFWNWNFHVKEREREEWHGQILLLHQVRNGILVKQEGWYVQSTSENKSWAKLGK